MLAQQELLVSTVGALGGVIVGAAGALILQRVVLGRIHSRAKEEARQIRETAEREARTAAEEIRLTADKKALERKEKLDEEVEATRKELRDQERRLGKREDLVDRKEEMLALKEQTLTKEAESLRQRGETLTQREEEAEKLVEERREAVSRVAGLTREEAREEAIQLAESDARHDAAHLVRKITTEAEDQAREKATEIVLNAVQRFATEITSESTVRTVSIPSDDMKGRIIGREGRNIRAIEKATGVDIIVDDTPGVIVVSCFDRIRQAVAVESMNRLIADGRMHPSRIEEVVDKVRKEFDERVMKNGRDAVLEVNLRNVNPKVSEAMGKLSFRTSYGQNVLRHSIEVAYFCQIIADQLGLNGAIARRCGFLHDIGKAMDHEMEGGHPKIGMEFARQHGEKEPVLNAIGGHHADIPSTSFYTPIVMAADAVSSARPGARRESMEKYIQRLNELQDIALSERGVNEAYAIQAGREVRVMVDAKRVSDDEAHLIAGKIAKRVADEMTFPGEIRVTVLRETRAIEYAR